MRLLLDTQILLWVLADAPQLKKAARDLIADAEEVYFSAASVWEIAIKVRLGKIDVEMQALLSALNDSGFLELPVAAKHAAGVAVLAIHHKDPFDRLLVAQALAVPLKLLTADPILAGYSDLVVVD